jgi:hypothetical protein
MAIVAILLAGCSLYTSDKKSSSDIPDAGDRYPDAAHWPDAAVDDGGTGSDSGCHGTPDGGIIYPDGGIIYPDAGEGPDGGVIYPDAGYGYPDASEGPDGGCCGH